jgi:peptidoglycan/LPS O-acetylase OafA/YrhL
MSVGGGAARNESLDGVRGLASISIVVYHFGPHIASREGPFGWLHDVPSLLLQGVDLFFVLSGYLIVAILLEHRESPRLLRTFYARRAYRVLPLYYIVLASYLLVMNLFAERAGASVLCAPPVHVWPYALHGQNVLMGLTGSFGPRWLAGTWSLAVEEQFYAVAPLYVRRVSDRAVVVAGVGCVLSALVLRASIQKFKFVDPMCGYVLLPCRADSLALGALAAVLWRTHRAWFEARSSALLASACGLTAAWLIYGWLPNPHAIRLAFLSHTVHAVIFAAWLLALLTAPASRLARTLATAPLRWLGLTAYGTYLLHPIVLGAAFLYVDGGDPRLESTRDLGVVVVAFAATLVVASVSWVVLERPLVRRGHRLRY